MFVAVFDDKLLPNTLLFFHTWMVPQEYGQVVDKQTAPPFETTKVLHIRKRAKGNATWALLQAIASGCCAHAQIQS